MKKVFLVEDNEVDQLYVETLLVSYGYYEVIVCNSGKEFDKKLQNVDVQDIACILLDLGLPDVFGMKILQKLKTTHADIPVILVTGSTETKHALSALRFGAVEYLSKPVKRERLDKALKNAEKYQKLAREFQSFSKQENTPHGLHRLIGLDQRLRGIKKQAEKAAESAFPVLISGAVSTGKKMLSLALHEQRGLKNAAYVVLECGTIKNLAETLSVPTGDTVILNHIESLTKKNQKLLRSHLAQQKKGQSEECKTVKIIALTSEYLYSYVEEGIFDSDLYYRLESLHIECPPLAERLEDMEDLANYFIRQAAWQEGRDIKLISDDALTMLKRHDWSGNIAELRNVISKAYLNCSGPVIQNAHIVLKTEDFKQKSAQRFVDQGAVINIMDEGDTIKPLAKLEHEIVSKALQQCNNNVSKAARELGITRATFYKKLGEQRW